MISYSNCCESLKRKFLAYDSIDTRFMSVLLSTAIMCPELPAIENGMVSWSGLSPGGVATYTCDDGFILVGDPTRICRDDGTWSGEEPTCERKLLSPLHVYCCTIIHLLLQFLNIMTQ